MILAFLVFVFGIAQVLVQRDVISQDTKFHFAIVAITLSAVPLGIQGIVLLMELSHLPRKYWVKLLIHRLVMDLLGDNGQAANLAANYFQRNMRWGFIRGFLLKNKYFFSKDKFTHLHEMLLGSILLPILVILWGIDIVVFIIYMATFIIANIMGLLIAKLLDAVLFQDAFSAMYHMKNMSLAVSLEDERSVESFYDSRGRKKISKWEYPYILEEALPMILRDLDLRRMEFFKRLKEPPEQAESFDQSVTINNFLEREVDLRWEVLEKNEQSAQFWKEVFKREEALRWYVLSGKELTQELFTLEKIKLEVARLEFEEMPTEMALILQELRETEQPKQQRGQTLISIKSEQLLVNNGQPSAQQSEIQPEEVSQQPLLQTSVQQSETQLEQMLQQPLLQTSAQQYEQSGQLSGQLSKQQSAEQSGQPGSLCGSQAEPPDRLHWPLQADFLKVLRKKRKKQLKQVMQLESEQLTRIESRLKLKQKEDTVEKIARVHEDIRFASWGQVHYGVGRGTEILQPYREKPDPERRVMLECRLKEMEVELKNMEEEWAKPMDKGWLRQQLRPLKAHKMNKLESLMEANHHELPYELQDEQLAMTKVVWSMRLEVVFLPSYTSRSISYFITATGSQDSFLSKLYLEEFSGHSSAANAAEFLKLMEILDNDTFVVKRQATNPRLKEVDGVYILDEQEKMFSLPCESLKHIVKSILDDGKTLDAVHVKSISYV